MSPKSHSALIALEFLATILFVVAVKDVFLLTLKTLSPSLSSMTASFVVIETMLPSSVAVAVFPCVEIPAETDDIEAIIAIINIIPKSVTFVFILSPQLF